MRELEKILGATMKVKIYKPTKNAMQSGKGNIKKWSLKYLDEDTRYVEPIMGWTGNKDPKSQLKLSFDTKEEAIAYAERNKLEYQVVEPQKAKVIIKAYSDNFTS